MDTPDDPIDFEDLLRRAAGPDGARAIVRALGIEPMPGRPDRTGFGPAPAGGDDAVNVEAIGERGGLLVVLVTLRGKQPSDVLAREARRMLAARPMRPLLILFADDGFRRWTFASFGLDGRLRRLSIETDHVRRTDVEALEEMRARPDEVGVALARRHARALDRSRVTRQFFRDVRAHRAHVAEAWSGVPRALSSEREQLALLFLCRLIFLYFLQNRGHLAGDRRFLPRRVDEWRGEGGDATVFRAVLVPLFFGALNTRPEERSPEARRLGELPYLNGGLFERHALERRFPELDLPDQVATAVFERLLERYRFTTREPAEAAAERSDDAGIDPETLGRVFEALMSPGRRGSTGTFYTPVAIVDRVVCAALETHLSARSGLSRAQASALVKGARADGIPDSRRARLVRDLDRLRVLDPACGSGAFLIGALSRLARVRAALDGGRAWAFRRPLVRHALYGVDLLDDAALLCALRLWLALADTGEGVPSPLPNLDRRVRQGNALVDPFDIGIAGRTRRRAARTDATVRRTLRALVPLAERYIEAGPDEKSELRRRLARRERALADAWVDAFDRRLTAEAAELRAVAGARDLFGARPPEAERAAGTLRSVEAKRKELTQLRAALADGSRPFFSFRVHFAEAATPGFDLVLSNPPWIRAHRWPAALRETARRRYRVCREAGWRRGARLAGAPAGAGGQVDLSLLFLERSLDLLRPGGTLGMLLPAKSLRSLYGAAARRLLLHDAELVEIEDHALAPGSFFRADAFAAAVVARKRQSPVGRGSEPPGHEALATTEPPASPPIEGDGRTADRRPATRVRPSGIVRVAVLRRDAPTLSFAVERADLPVLPEDAASPWLLAPPGARAALRRMQRAGPPLGETEGLSIRRGVVTGANRVLVMRRVEPKLGDLARVTAEGRRRARRAGETAGAAGRFRALVEASALRPLIRGRDVQAWSYRVERQLLWVHDDRTARPGPAPPRAGRYLHRHARVLRARSGWRPELPLGAVFRASPDTLGPKVVWHDLAETLKAVAVPARVRGVDGRPRPLVPLNTVYFIPVADEGRALVLAAYLNSRPVRIFARAIAQRAKDARFRFLAWTVGLTPLPDGWAEGADAARLRAISRRAHESGALEPDDEREMEAVVGARYGLTPAHRRALGEFDRWLAPRAHA